MDKEELLEEILEAMLLCENLYNNGGTVLEGDDTFQIIGKCIEKQIPKTPINIVYDDQYIEYWNCPYCHIQHSGEITLFCDNCGQALDCLHNDE